MDKDKERADRENLRLAKENIVLKGHIGTWYVIDEINYKGSKYYILEHEQYGDMTSHKIIDSKLNIIVNDSYNGKLDLIEYFKF